MAVNLCPGNYSVDVVDAGGDTVTLSVTIVELDSLGGEIAVSLESCGGCNDGTLSFTATGGATPYTYQWDDPLNQTTFIATGLSANGNYTLVVSDVNGCSYTVANLTLGAESIQVEKLSLRLSPNPTSGDFVITALEGTMPAKSILVITDINGRVLVRKKIKKGLQQMAVSTKGWQSGVYLLTVQNEEGVQFSDKLVFTSER